MSKSQSTGSDLIKNPSAHYIQWSGEKGVFSYFDKTLGENVELDSLEFVVLDSRSSIGGWHEDTKSRIYSNYTNRKDEEFVVKESRGNKVLAKGVYADIRRDDFDFVTNVFSLAKLNDEWKLVQIQFKTSALSKWSDYVESVGGRFKVYDVLTKTVDAEEHKQGRVNWKTPVFEPDIIEDDVNDLAIQCDKTLLQPYLSQFVTERKEESAETAE